MLIIIKEAFIWPRKNGVAIRPHPCPVVDDASIQLIDQYINIDT